MNIFRVRLPVRSHPVHRPAQGIKARAGRAATGRPCPCCWGQGGRREVWAEYRAGRGAKKPYVYFENFRKTGFLLTSIRQNRPYRAQYASTAIN